MLIDLLNSSNYIMINRDAIRIFGLNTAVYCSEILNIYKKALDKEKFIDPEEKIFKVDRRYIEKQTTLTLEDQIKCDLNLSKIGVINIAKEDKDVMKFDIEKFASILSSEDIKLLNSVSKKVKVNNPKGVSDTKRSRMVLALKEAVICKDYDIMIAIRDWIDAIMANPSKYMSKAQVELFTGHLLAYSNGDKAKALEIVHIATIHQYIDCQWAINLYEKDKELIPTDIKKTGVRTTSQKITQNVGEEEF